MSISRILKQIPSLTTLLTLLLGIVSSLSFSAELKHEYSTENLILREHHSGIMGTDLHITVLGHSPNHLDKAINAAITELQRIENMMTDWRPSPLTDLNRASGQSAFRVPHELAVIISHGLEMGKRTNGAFDITYAGIDSYWNFQSDTTVLPDLDAVQQVLSHVDFRKVSVDMINQTVTLPLGMKIGLGGIAKGYGIDRAIAVLMDMGIKHAIVNAGGDMKILGKKFGEPWEIAIKHPRDLKRTMASLKLSNSALVTSGDYERFFEVDGRRYHHIIDPRTGFPSEGCLSATVVAPVAEFADALATAMCVLGPTKGFRIIENLDLVEAILVGMDGTVLASSGLRNTLR
jgi:thiamine biosynthesis lipoprotein